MYSTARKRVSFTLFLSHRKRGKSNGFSRITNRRPFRAHPHYPSICRHFPHRLASAVANEGGIGVIAAAMIGMREPDVASNPQGANARALQMELRKARELTQGVLGVNIMVVLTDFASLVRTAVEEKRM